MNNELKTIQCGCGGEAKTVLNEFYNYLTHCLVCGMSTRAFDTEAEAITAWNKAMGAKDINVPNKFATDTNVWNKTAKFKQDGEFLRCGKCNHIVDSGYKYCSECGSRLEFE